MKRFLTAWLLLIAAASWLLASTLISETWTCADSDSLNCDYANWTECCTGDDWDIVSNTARNAFDNGTISWARTATIGTADYTTQADVNPGTSGNFGVCARRVANGASDSDWYTAFVHDGNDQFTVYKRAAASWTLLGFYNTAIAYGTFYTVKVYARGTTIKGFLNGTERVSATDSALSAAGDACIARSSFGQTTVWDNFLVEDFSAGGAAARRRVVTP